MTGDIRFVCTDKGTHPSRELAVLEPLDEEERRFLADPPPPPPWDHRVSPDELEAMYRWERLGNWATNRNARRGGQVRTSKVMAGWTQGNDDSFELRNPGDGRGYLLRFRCPTCRRDVPMRSDTLEKLIEGVRAAGRAAVDISYLPANLR